MEVTREVVLEAPVEDVWAALTEAVQLEEWFANDVELELVPGGEGVLFRWDDGEERHAVVEIVEPERRFEFTWDDSRVCIELEAVPAGTRVLVPRRSAPAGDALALHAMALAQRRVTDVFAALADPNRRHLLEALARNEASATSSRPACPSRDRPSRSTSPRSAMRASSIRAARAARRCTASTRARSRKPSSWITRVGDEWDARLAALRGHLRAAPNVTRT